jgi:hypothetical protein
VPGVFRYLARGARAALGLSEVQAYNRRPRSSACVILSLGRGALPPQHIRRVTFRTPALSPASGHARAVANGVRLGQKPTLTYHQHVRLDDFEVVAVIKIGEVDPNTVIWRYLTFSKFASVIDLGALWFSKLKIFEDAQEGVTPEVTRRAMKAQNLDMENWFPDEERKRQVRRFVEDNEENGRELIVASCWFIAEHESEEMWAGYAKDDEGVVIKSTAGDLTRSLVRSHDKWWIGKVRYIDLATHDGMNVYEAHQAHLRAFLKSNRYSHESELRVATMNLVAPGCLNPDGSPQTASQHAGFTNALSAIAQ